MSVVYELRITGCELQIFMFKPIYIETAWKGILRDRIAEAHARMDSCTLCPRSCGVNRNEGELGVCKTGRNAIISSFHPHFGEEAPLVGIHGSGTIFFTHCNLLCNFCQNYDISHLGAGEEVSDNQLAGIMLHLQNKACQNINFVTPSHVIPQILSALEIAIDKGLNIPLVYNTGGYDSVDSLELLDGIIDIYMPDLKLLSNRSAQLSEIPSDYPEIVKKAICEMHRQVGDLMLNIQGIAQRGLLVRHLVLPNDLNSSNVAMEFLARDISQNTYVNIMDQYRPCYKAGGIPELSRPITKTEFREALEAARRNGLSRIDR